MRGSLNYLLLMINVLAEKGSATLFEWEEVRFYGGVANASSRVHPTDEGPEGAFYKDKAQPWRSGGNAKGEHGKRGPSFPHLIWYDFKDRYPKIVPAEVSIRTAQIINEYGPTKWQFIGSNDDKCDEFSAWTLLCEDLSGQNFKSPSENKFCNLDAKPHQNFRCLGIRVLGVGSYRRNTVIAEIRMWEKVVRNFG